MPSIYLSPSLQEFNEYYDKSGSEEYYMNLIADAMEPYLEASDISFVRNSPDMTLTQVIRESNAGNYDLHLALHSNAAPDYLSGQLTGPDFYYFTRSVRGKRAATVLADNYMKIYPDPSKVTIMPTTSLAEVTRTRAPAVLAELAYHDNPEDAEWIKNNINAIAKNLVEGLTIYFGIPFVDPFEDEEYIRHFRIILEAIRKCSQIKFEMVNRKGNMMFVRCRPVRLEYSEKDDKFRVITAGCRAVSTVNLANIRFCAHYTGERQSVGEEKAVIYDTVTVKIRDERNAMERFMLHFAHFEKQAEKLDRKNYFVKIKYAHDDESEMVIRMITFGPMGEVTG